MIGFGIFFGMDLGGTKPPTDTAGNGAKETTAQEAEALLHAPRFEDARIYVWDGQPRAYVGFTIIGRGDHQYASPETIRAVGEDDRAVDWKHQTATGGPADVVAMDGSQVVAPGSPDGGDADYFDASDVHVGETVTVTFRFVLLPNPWDGSAPPRAVHVVKVPFRVVQAN